MRHVLITGAAGLIGRAVGEHLAGLGVGTTGLVLEDPGDVPVDRVVVGSATDRETVAKAMRDADSVVHLAALASPSLGTADQVFGGNTQATFTVLDVAGEAGVSRAVIASSINSLGYRYGPKPTRPHYVPIDERLPTRAADAYSLSKHVDEATAAAMARRYGMTVVALRLPMVGRIDGSDLRMDQYFAQLEADPQIGAPDLWLYLDTRDVARAAELSLGVAGTGAHVVLVAAPTTSVPYPTEQLLDVYHTEVPRRASFSGRAAPVDMTVARSLLGFSARYLREEFQCRDLPNLWAGREV